MTFGNGEVTTGGNALKFYSSIRVDIRRIGALKQRDEIVGNRTRIKVIKNKLAPPFRQIETEIHYGAGLCPAAELLTLADEAGLLQRSGSWISLGDERLGNGREAVRERLLNDPELRGRLEQLVAPDLGSEPAEA